MPEIIAGIISIFGFIVYQSVKARNVKKGLFMTLIILLLGVLLKLAGILSGVVFLVVLARLYRREKRPGYPYSARAGQIRAWHSLHKIMK